eukprot:1149401-Pelagomonas_calceolata.AAC.2
MGIWNVANHAPGRPDFPVLHCLVPSKLPPRPPKSEVHIRCHNKVTRFTMGLSLQGQQGFGLQPKTLADRLLVNPKSTKSTLAPLKKHKEKTM